MMTIRQMMQERPKGALDLLSRLLDTSDTALKTRDRLVSELKQELQDMAVLEEQHLFPVLRKHKELKDLVREAVDDNKETKALLADLERTPRDSEEFAKKVATLRRTFQQHVRDEKKELLPAIVKALSDEEAASVVETMDGRQAEIEETRRAKAEQLRREAQKQREPLEDAEGAKEVFSDALNGEAEMIKRAATEGTEAVQRGSEQSIRLLSSVTEEVGKVARRTSDDLRALTESSEAFGRGLQSISREWVELSQSRMQQNLDDLSAMFGSRTLPDLMAAQTTMVRHNVEMMLENSQRIMRSSMRMAEKARQLLEQAR
jgi:hypothetical protein